MAGEVHRLALDYELQDLAPSGALDYCFPPGDEPVLRPLDKSDDALEMVFTTHLFVFYFLPLFLLIYFNLPYRWRNLWITLASYMFYGWWQPWFVCLMLFTTVLDFAWGKVITRPGATRREREACRGRVRDHQPELPRLFQILHVRRRNAEPAPGGGGRRSRSACCASCCRSASRSTRSTR